MIRRPPRSTLDRSSAASDVYKRQAQNVVHRQEAPGVGVAGVVAIVAQDEVLPFGHNPVSYTHLRAHETVLDLVCRLLLEKKKPHNTKTADTYYTTNI